jgi:hypothetical protein
MIIVPRVYVATVYELDAADQCTIWNLVDEVRKGFVVRTSRLENDGPRVHLAV